VPFTYPYPRPSVTCDVVVFTMRADDLAVLLVQRKDEPFKGAWALPGGFVNENEALERAAARELYEETSLTGANLEQLAAFGDPGRDPRGHTVTVAYVAFVLAEANVAAGDDAAAVAWHAFKDLSLMDARSRSVPPPRKNRRRSGLRPTGPVELAFDHARIVTRAYRRLCRHLDDPVRDPVFDVVPPRFTLAELRRIYEVVGGRAISARTFKKHFVERGLVLPATGKPAPNPAAQLYRWNRK
jgi:8-oxo-dGTP diphosphatase